MKNFQTIIRKRSVIYLTLISLTLFTFYACRKDFSIPHSSTMLSEDLRVQRAEISKWIKAQQVPLPSTVKWSKAQQAIVAGAHVVRIPISKSSCLVFVKLGKDSLKVFAFDWQNETPGQPDFSGTAAWSDFQNDQTWSQRYSKGEPIGEKKLEKGNQISIKKQMYAGGVSTGPDGKLSIIAPSRGGSGGQGLSAWEQQAWSTLVSYVTNAEHYAGSNDEYGNDSIWGDYYYTYTAEPTISQSEILANTLGIPDMVEYFDYNSLDKQYSVDALLEDSSPESIAALAIMARERHNSGIYGPYGEAYFNLNIAPSLIGDANDISLLGPYWQYYYNAQVAIVKFQHPEWSDGTYAGYWKIRYEATKEMMHFFLDLGGLVPVIGEVCDLTNGVIYSIEGDNLNATLSYASTIPIAGWFASGYKFAIKRVVLSNGSKIAFKLVGKTDNLVHFGNRGQLRQVLNLAVGNPLQAHHLIPWQFTDDPIIQAAAKWDFHMNEALNGIPLPTSVHIEGMVHLAYNDRVTDALQVIKNNIGTNPSPEVAKTALETLIARIRTAIDNNPGVNLNYITF